MGNTHWNDDKPEDNINQVQLKVTILVDIDAGEEKEIERKEGKGKVDEKTSFPLSR